jgi:hypothetical protein
MPKYNSDFVASKVHFLLDRAKERAALRAPVELAKLAVIQGVHHLDVRPMFPSGGLACVGNGFAVYIRDLNLVAPKLMPLDTDGPEPLLTVRQRFTLAHEIAHTLFFDANVPPQELAGAPRGRSLELLCQVGARQLLLPEDLISPLIDKGQQITADLVRSIADQFKASPEVVIRRLDESGVVKYSGPSLLMVRAGAANGEAQVIAVRYDDSLTPYRVRPELFSSFSSWDAGLLPEEFRQTSAWSGVVRVNRMTLNVRKTSYGSSSFFVEIHVLPAI